MKKPNFFFYHDGRHPLIYMYEPPMTKEEYESAINELVGTPVEAISFCLGDGRTMLHETEVGELWGSPIDKWAHIIFRRAHQNAKQLIERGDDPLRIVCDRAKEKGILIYPTLLVQQGTGKRGQDMRSSNFRWNNRQLEIGAGGDLAADYPGIECLDFKHQEVRDERFAIIEETLNKYDVAGFELQLYYVPYYFHPNEVEAGLEIMTNWIRRVRDAVKKSGQDRELAVRVRADFDWCRSRGLDVESWIKEGLIDVVVGVPEDRNKNDPSGDFRSIVAAAKGTSCRVLAGLHSAVGSDRLDEATIEQTRATACNYWRQGVDGIYLIHWFARWPYKADFYEILRELSDPDVMAAKDKTYFVPTEDQSGTQPRHQPGVVRRLPVDLAVGRPATVQFSISDDLARWDEVGRVHEVLLRVRTISTTELDRLQFKLNGKPLPDSSLRKINQMYLMSAPRYRMGGYWWVFRLDRHHWPVEGENSLEIELIERDSEVHEPIYVRDVELEIKYLMGKNFHRDFVDTDLGPYMDGN
jgi:hypothetical protein